MQIKIAVQTLAGHLRYLIKQSKRSKLFLLVYNTDINLEEDILNIHLWILNNLRNYYFQMYAKQVASNVKFHTKL